MLGRDFGILGIDWAAIKLVDSPSALVNSYLAAAHYLDFAFFFLSRTPDPSPFSSTKITQGASRAALI